MMTLPAKRRLGAGPLDQSGQTFENPSVLNLAALALLNVAPEGVNSSLPEGWEVYVQSKRAYFIKRTSAVAPVAQVIVASTVTAGVQWWRKDCDASDGNPWVGQLAWAVNPATGNDENVGTPASPLASVPEFIRRLRGAKLNAIYSLSILGNVDADGIDLGELDLGPNGMVVIDGNAGATPAAGAPPAPWPAGVTVAAIGGYTAPVPGGPEYAIITANVATLADWTPYVGCRVRCSGAAFPHPAGALDRCTFYVIQVNPAGGGNNTARITIPNGFDPYDPLMPGLTGLVPLNGDFLYAEDLPQGGRLQGEISKEFGAVLPSVNVVGLNLTDATGDAPLQLRARVPSAIAAPMFGKPTVFGCIVDAHKVAGSMQLWEIRFANPGGGLLIQGDNIENDRIDVSHSAFDNVNPTTSNVLINNTLFEGCVWTPRGFNRMAGANGMFDNPGGTAINVDQPGTRIQSSGTTFGDTLARGLYVTVPDFVWVYDVAPAVNAGGVSEFRVLGAEYTWGANLPYPAAATVEMVAIRPPVL